MKIIKTILSVILSLLSIVTLYALFLISNISFFFSTDNIRDAASNIDVVHEIKKIQNSSSVAGGKEDISNVVDKAYAEAENHGISKNLVDEMLNSKEVKGFLGTAIGNTTDYIINGKENKNVTSTEFNKLVDNNIDKWIDKADIDISDTKKEVLDIRLKQASAGIIDNLPSQQLIDSKIDTNTLKSIQFLFSKEVKTALVVITMISFILIVLFKRKEYKCLIYIAMALLVSGLITIATSFVINDLLALVLNEYNLSFMINSIGNNFSEKMFITGIISSVIAVIMFIIYMILVKKTLKKVA